MSFLEGVDCSFDLNFESGLLTLIRHFHFSHNTHCLPPKILHKHCHIFLLEPLFYPGEIKNKGYAKFEGQTSSIMGDMQMANKYFGLSMNQDPYSALSEFR